MQINDVRADAFHRRVDFQGVAESVERGAVITHLQMALAQPRGGAEVERVELQRAAAVGNRFQKAPNGEVGDGPVESPRKSA